jgi:purine-binding chemotaxis protein CheW
MDSPKLPDPSPPPPAPPDDLAEFFYRPELEGTGSTGRTTERPDELRELLVFSLANEQFAIDVPRVQEIVMPPPLSDVPRARSHVLGVTMIRGTVVPVFDLRPRLELSPASGPDPHARVIVIHGSEGTFGLWVDHVEAVVRLAPAALEPPPAGIGGEGEPITAIGRRGSGVFAVLDVETLLPGER